MPPAAPSPCSRAPHILRKEGTKMQQREEKRGTEWPLLSAPQFAYICSGNGFWPSHGVGVGDILGWKQAQALGHGKGQTKRAQCGVGAQNTRQLPPPHEDRWQAKGSEKRSESWLCPPASPTIPGQ